MDGQTADLRQVLQDKIPEDYREQQTGDLRHFLGKKKGIEISDLRQKLKRKSNDSSQDENVPLKQKHFDPSSFSSTVPIANPALSRSFPNPNSWTTPKQFPPSFNPSVPPPQIYQEKIQHSMQQGPAALAPPSIYHGISQTSIEQVPEEALASHEIRVRGRKRENFNIHISVPNTSSSVPNEEGQQRYDVNHSNSNLIEQEHGRNGAHRSNLNIEQGLGRYDVDCSNLNIIQHEQGHAKNEVHPSSSNIIEQGQGRYKERHSNSNIIEQRHRRNDVHRSNSNIIEQGHGRHNLHHSNANIIEQGHGRNNIHHINLDEDIMEIKEEESDDDIEIIEYIKPDVPVFSIDDDLHERSSPSYSPVPSSYNTFPPPPSITQVSRNVTPQIRPDNSRFIHSELPSTGIFNTSAATSSPQPLMSIVHPQQRLNPLPAINPARPRPKPSNQFRRDRAPISSYEEELDYYDQIKKSYQFMEELEEELEIQKNGLRPIVIDGSDVAFITGKQEAVQFSAKRIDICVKFFKNRGHTIIKAFLPEFRRSEDPELLGKLEQDRNVIFTPRRWIGNRWVNSSDDLIIEFAEKTEGIIISRNLFKGALLRRPKGNTTINQQLLMPTFVGDFVMFPHDPLGKDGPNLDQFLKV